MQQAKDAAYATQEVKKNYSVKGFTKFRRLVIIVSKDKDYIHREVGEGMGYWALCYIMQNTDNNNLGKRG